MGYSDGSLFELVTVQPEEGDGVPHCLVEQVQLRSHGPGQPASHPAAARDNHHRIQLISPSPCLTTAPLSLPLSGEVWGLATAREGERFASASEDRTLRLWKVDEEVQLLFQGHKASVDCATLLHPESFVSGSQVQPSSDD